MNFPHHYGIILNSPIFSSLDSMASILALRPLKYAFGSLVVNVWVGFVGAIVVDVSTVSVWF